MRTGNFAGAGFTGTGTAMVTPFCERGIDYAAMGEMIKRQIDSGVDFLVVLGTTGEASTISRQERRELIGFVMRAVDGAVPVVVGAGGNDTASVVELCEEAGLLGANGALVVTPYYNKPTQEGLYRHYEAVARDSRIPVIAYNVPGRTGVNMLPETVERLTGIEGVVGVKEASGSIGQADEILARVRRARPEFLVLSGNDDQTFHMLNSGGDGVISVLSNVAPGETARMVALAMEGRVSEARGEHMRLLPLVRSLFAETSPAPTKYALARMGLCENRLRLPLVEASAKCMKQIDGDLAACGLLDASGEASERKAV